MREEVYNYVSTIKDAEEKLLGGGELLFDEALVLTGVPDRHASELAATANRVRQRYSSDKADLCSIVNARSGVCPEDCHFCSQSSHYRTDTPVYGMKTAREILAAAAAAETAGAHRFCIVTSGDSLTEKDFSVVLDALSLIAEETSLKRCASLGRLNQRRAGQLRDAGLNRYHHNIETSSSFFPKVCSTHSRGDKLKTIALLKENDIETCIGGILNMGESPRQRIEFAFELKELEPDSVPVNFLIPREGTPMADRPAMPAVEAARYLAIFRLIMPAVSLRLAGGRLETFAGKPALPFGAGANALLIGDLLTTRGPDARNDITLLGCLGFDTNDDD